MENIELHDIAKVKALKNNSKWSSWSSPVGFVIFINGLAIFAILTRYFFLMN